MNSNLPEVTNKRLKQQATDAIETMALKKAIDRAGDDIEQLPRTRERVSALEERMDDVQSLEVIERTNTASIRELLGKLKAVEGKLSASAKAKSPPPPAADMIAALMTADLLRRVNRTATTDTLKQLVEPHHLPLVRALEKSATTTATSTVDGWASQLMIHSTIGYWDQMAAESAVAALMPYCRTLNLNGLQSVRIPRRNHDKSLGGGWVAENETIPVRSGEFAANTLNRFKLGVITATSNELAETGVHNIQTILRDAMLEDTALTVDHTFMSADAGVVATSPAGILNTVVPVTASTETGVEAVSADLRVIMDFFASIRARTPVIVMSHNLAHALVWMTDGNGLFPFRSEIQSGTLGGIPVVVTSNMAATDQIIALDGDSLFIARDLPQFDSSSSTSLVLVDADSPAPFMGDGDVPEGLGVHVSDAADVAGGPARVQSMFQTNGTAFRLISPITWQFARPGAVMTMTTVGW